MNLRKERRVLRGLPPAAALMMAGVAHAAPSVSEQNLAVSLSQPPGGGAGVSALMRTLRDAAGQQHRGPRPTGAATLAVTSCADDGSGGTLRTVVSAAASGDVVDLSALTCSTITLAQGAIPVVPDELTIRGPGAQHLAIDGAGIDRVFVHYGYTAFTVSALTVRNGVNHVSGNHVAAGACIIGNSYVVLDHSVVTGCSATGEGAYGGAIIATNIALDSSTVSGNVAQGSLLNGLTASYGGGVFAYHGFVVIIDSTVSGNRATLDPNNPNGSYDTGGGVFTDNGGYAFRSTFDGNYSSGTGGGIATHGTFLLSDSTVSGNTAKNKSGGGVFVRSTQPFVSDNSTVAHNTAPVGAGVYFGLTPPQHAEFQSTIVANNTGGDIGAKLDLTLSGAANLIMSVAHVTAPPDTLQTDPHLLLLAANGGPTRTHALAAGSVAIDHGNNAAALTTDQRGNGFARSAGPAPDIGAFELPAAVVAAPAQPVPASSVLQSTLLGLLLGLWGVRALVSQWPRRRPSSS